MTREKAKRILEAYIACESKKAHFECDDYNCDDNCPLLYEMGTVGEFNEAINMAIQALETWNNLFKSYEVLTKEITESGNIKNATKRIDNWCIEQLRGIIGDYYADLIIKESEI